MLLIAFFMVDICCYMPPAFWFKRHTLCFVLHAKCFIIRLEAAFFMLVMALYDPIFYFFFAPHFILHGIRSVRQLWQS